MAIMKRILLVLVNLPIAALLLFACETSPEVSENKCSDIVNGKFETTNDDGSKSVITRKGNKQEEITENGKIISEYKVKWVSDCQYLLYDRKVIKGVDKYPNMINDTLEVNVIQVNKDNYLTKCSFKAYHESFHMRIKILK